jgi:crossover junction endodeoxyribonuclease RuvC
MALTTILGIDPGMATTGWGIIQKTPPDRFTLIRYGCLLTPARHSLVSRLQDLARQLRELVQKEKPDAAAVEELFFSKESRSAASVGHARGAILLVLSDLKIPIYEYNPRQVKTALTGYGSADKSQMQRMTQRLLRLNEIPKPDDAADALAIALCHLNTVHLEKALA